MIARLGRLPRRRGQARDLRRRALLRRLSRRPGLRARVPAGRAGGGRRERHPLRHQRLQPARPGRRGDGSGRRRARRRGPASASTRTTTPNAPSPTRWPRWTQGASLVQGTMNGYRRAHRQRQPGLDPARAPAQDGLRVRGTGPARAAHRRRPLRRRAAQPHAGPGPALRRPQRVRAQGRHARGRGRRRRRAPSSTWTRTLVGNQRDLVVSELSGKGTVLARAERAGIPLDDEQAARAVRTLKEREHRGYQYEAADASFELLLRRESGALRAALPARGLPASSSRSARTARSSTEATIKIWVDGERYVRTAEGNGPVNALDKALRGAIIDRPPAPRRHRADQLQGPDPRRAPRHRRGHAGAARLLRRRPRAGARSASPRTSSRPPGRRWSTRSSTPFQPRAAERRTAE